jgi:5-methylcytosine-specific restriction protein A
LSAFHRFVRRAHAKLQDVAHRLRSPKWRRLEKQWLATNKLCSACATSKHLQVHHIKPFHLDPELELDPNNLITLCMDEPECHLLIGHGGNFKCFNPHVRKDAEHALKHPHLRWAFNELAKKNRRADI